MRLWEIKVTLKDRLRDNFTIGHGTANVAIIYLSVAHFVRAVVIGIIGQLWKELWV